jgi:hypothetical protein
VSFWAAATWPSQEGVEFTLKGDIAGQGKKAQPTWLYPFSHKHQMSKKDLRTLYEGAFDKLLPRYISNTDIKDICKDYNCNFDLVSELWEGDVPTHVQLEKLLFLYQKYLLSFKNISEELATTAMFLFGVTLTNSLNTELHPKDYELLMKKTCIQALINHFWGRLSSDMKKSEFILDFLHDLRRANVHVTF